jgi:hypothetical protein
MAMMHKCHGHLMAVDGVQCAAAAEADAAKVQAATNPPPGGPVKVTSAEAEHNGVGITAGGAGTDRGEAGKDKNTASVGEDLAKVLADERAEKAVLVKTLAEIVKALADMPGWRLCSIISRTASIRKFSTALAGDWRVSARNARLNWRGLRCAASASCRTVSGLSRLRFA